MKTATLRDLRNNFTKLKNWLREGEAIEIHRRREVVAVLSLPSQAAKNPAPPMPDFRRRRESLDLCPLDTADLQALRSFEEEDREG